jgi:rhodanese-related sulfurtransferase
MRRTLQRAVLIVVAGVTLGLAGNAVSPRGIAWITPPKKVVEAKDTIPLPEAQALWEAGDGFFLDARRPEDFAAGHIAGAFNLPAHSFDAHFQEVAPMLAPDARIVVYCDGVECELSHQLAGSLRELGFTDVRVLINGWTEWRRAGLATITEGAQ